MAKSCFFISHRGASAEIYPALLAEVEHHVTEYGVTDFFVGHYGSFDRMAAQAVKEVKKRHPEVTTDKEQDQKSYFTRQSPKV